MKRTWDWFVIILATYTFIYQPLFLVFDDVQKHFDENEAMQYLEIFVDAAFVIDMGLSFFTSYIDTRTGERITQPKLIARNYMTGEFITDLVSVLPLLLEQVLQAQIKQYDWVQSMIKIFRLMKLIRVFQVFILITNSNLSQERKGMIRAVLIVVLLFFLAHAIACLLYPSFRRFFSGVSWT
mgnify:CR=1 FL=1